MNNIEIVSATTQDDCDICDRMLEELMHFEKQFDNKIQPFCGGKHYNLEKVTTGNLFLVYAKINNTPVGFAMGRLNILKGFGNATNIVCLSTLFVKEKFRRMGVGTLLYNSFENWAKEKFGKDFAIEITAINKNINALEFYKSLGYKPIRTTLRKE